MPKSVDGDIRISVSFEEADIKKGTKNIQSSVSRVSRSIGKFGKNISAAYATGAEQVEKYNAKLAKAEEAVKKQENAVQALRDKLDALKNGDATPQSLKKLDAQIASAQKEFDALVDKMDKAKENADSLDIGIDSAELRQAKADYADLAEQVANAGGKLDAMKAKAESLRLNPQSTAEGKKLSRDIEVAESKLERLKNEAGFAAEELDKAKASASGMNEEIGKTPNAMKKSQTAVKRFKQLAVSAFVFNVFSKGMTNLRESVSNTLKTNTQFSNTVAKIKGNLLTAFAPIYQSALPAINALARGLSTVTAHIAAFIAALSGTTAEEAADAAENLYNQANATDAVTAATKEAEKSLASFDEINKITAGNDNNSSGIAPDFSGISEIDTSKATAAGRKLSPVLEAFSEFAKEIAEAFKEDIAPKLKSFGEALLGFLPDLENMNKDDIKGVLSAVAAGIGAIVAIKIAASVITGLTNFKDAVVSLANAISAHPVATAAVVLISLYNAMRLYADYQYNNSELGKLVDFYSDVTTESEAALEAVREFREEAEEKYNNLDEKFISLVTIADRYYDLSQKANLTDEDKHQLKVYYDYLTGEGIQLEDKINKITFAYAGTREELQNLIKDLMRYYYVQAYEELSVENLKKQLELEQKISEQEAASAKLKEAYNQAYNDFYEHYSYVDKLFPNIGAIPSIDGTQTSTGIRKFAENALKFLGGDKYSVALNDTEQEYKRSLDALSDLRTELQDLKIDAESYYSGSEESIDAYLKTLTGAVSDTNGKIESTKSKAEELGNAMKGDNFSEGLKTAAISSEVFSTKLNTNTKDTKALNTELDATANKTIAPDFSGLNSSLDTLTQKAMALLQKLREINSETTGDVAGVPNVKVGYSRLVPKLATGAVIPANREFLAVLGDQKSGTNIEAPLSTIEQAVENVLSRSGFGSSQSAILEIDGEKFGRLVYRLNKREGKRVGVNFSEG